MKLEITVQEVTHPIDNRGLLLFTSMANRRTTVVFTMYTTNIGIQAANVIYWNAKPME